MRGKGLTWMAASRELAVIADGPAIEDVAAAEAMAWAVRCIGRGGIAATAISAVDIALWNLKPRLTAGLAAPNLLPTGGPIQ